MSACEAAWRIQKYQCCYRSTSVMRLSFHLPGEQLIYFKADDEVEKVLNREDLDNSMFLAWFELNKVNDLAKTLTYVDIPTMFTYNSKDKTFKLREKGFAIGRINYVPRAIEDGYYMRILLNVQPGPRSFEELRTVDGILYEKWKDTCFALGLLDNDNEYIADLHRTSLWGSGFELRQLFIIMLDSLTSPETVWDATWQYLSEDIERKKRIHYNRPGIHIFHTCIFERL